MSDSSQLYGLQHARLSYLSLSPGVCSNSCPLSQWYCLTILSSAAHFFCLQTFPASGSFLMSQLFTSGSQSIGASTSASVLPMNIQGWFPLGLTGLTCLKSKRLSRVFSRTTVQKHQFFSTQPTLWSSSHIHTTGKTIALTRQTFVCKGNLCFLICCLGCHSFSSKEQASFHFLYPKVNVIRRKLSYIFKINCWKSP